MIIPSIRQIGSSTTQRIGASGEKASAFRVEPVPSVQAKTERRSGEGTANAAALRLGIAAQLLASRDVVDEAPLVLPLDPAMRMAARYATTLEGAAPLGSLGFSRTV